jgi:predicted glycosyltransferase involved in capsule biosynthesis
MWRQNKVMSQQLSIIIPFRGIDEYRIANLQATLCYLSDCFPNAKIRIVEQDIHSKVKKVVEQKGVEHSLIVDAGPFNKSKLINVGVSYAQTECILVSDADLLISRAGLEKSLAALATQLDFVRPYHRLIDLDKVQTAEYLAEENLPDGPKHGEAMDRSHLGEQLCIAGGAFMVRKTLFERVEGFDERFLGWGGEDDDFSLRVQLASSKIAVLKDGLGWHLWHPRTDVQQDENYQNNRALLRHTQLELARLRRDQR